jgi:hypothetical protein
VDFNSHTDTVVRVAVALVNLLTEGEERGRTYPPPAAAAAAGQLNALFAAVGSRTVVTEAEAGEFGGVAAQLRGVFTAVATGDIDQAAHEVNDMLKATGAHPLLERHDGETWHIHFHAAGEHTRVSGWAAGCATGLAIVLGGEHYDRLGVCTAPHCDRVKAAAFREARRGAAGSR